MGYDTSVIATQGIVNDAISADITVGSGSDRHLIACVLTDPNEAAPSGVSSDVDGAFSAVAGAEVANTVGRPGLSVYELDAPSTGTHTITANHAATEIHGLVVVSWNDLSSLRGGNAADGFSTTPSLGITTQADDIVLDFLGAADQSALPTDDEGSRREAEIAGSSPALLLASSDETATGTTTTTSWTIGSEDSWSVASVAFVPASEGGGSTSITGTLAGTSSDSAAATLDVALSGTLAGTSSDSATITTITDISGTVTDGGSAVQGALVYLIDQGSDTVYGTQTTDVNGDYRFTDVPTGTYHAVVEESGKEAASQPDLTVP